MSIRKRVPAVAGGLGAVVLLGLAANFAIGGQHYNTPSHHSQKSAKAHNVIMLLGDGMGVSEVTAARYYQYGADGRMNMDKLPFTGYQTTWSVKLGPPPNTLPDYVPDSAATGTAWSTGRKTVDERISQGPSVDLLTPGPNDGFTTALELAQRAGMQTGDVSTAEITDATPAVLASHMSNRACQGPADARSLCKQETKSAGGLGSIAEQEVDHGVDVILGGGKARFDQTLDDGSGTVTDYAQAQKGYRLVTDAAGLAGVPDLRIDEPNRLMPRGATDRRCCWPGPGSCDPLPRRSAARARRRGGRCRSPGAGCRAPGRSAVRRHPAPSGRPRAG